MAGWGGTGESWERGPYFVDGLVPLAYLLGDARLKTKAQKYIDWTLIHPSPDGMIGPASNNDWWPRMVMLKALAQYEEATSDPVPQSPVTSEEPVETITLSPYAAAKLRITSFPQLKT